ncbi:MAG: ORF6N domain-containing protein [Bacteroidales bacterium]|nr:ORF6N domain-containing protein [Bacteroidales bacterium]
MTAEETRQLMLPDEVITNKIYLIRGEKVMLDRDLAELFDVKAIRLREQLKRNLEKFPVHFMFRLTNEEVEIMVSQNAIPSKQHLGGSLPYVFTEHGVLQLANILKSGRAIQVSIKIIEVFVKMRKMLTDTLTLKLDIEAIKKKLESQDKNIELVFSYLDELMEKQENPKPRTQIGYKLPKSKN